MSWVQLVLPYPSMPHTDSQIARELWALARAKIERGFKRAVHRPIAARHVIVDVTVRVRFA